MYSSALSAAFIFVLAACASAMPALQARQTGASCAGLGIGAIDTTSYNFTLAAVNTTLPNSNSTGAPLVLAYGPGGDDPAASEWTISTYASWGANQWPDFSLESGALYPQPGPSEQGLGAYDVQVDQGGEVIFFVTILESSPSPSEIYCAVAESGLTRLAVNNDADHFSLCAATTEWIENTQYNLVYYASPDNSDYVYDTCYSVDVQLIPN